MSAIAVTVRKAVMDDVPAIHEILAVYARRGIVLERSPEDLAFYLKNFTVAEADGRTALRQEERKKKRPKKPSERQRPCWTDKSNRNREKCSGSCAFLFGNNLTCIVFLC